MGLVTWTGVRGWPHSGWVRGEGFNRVEEIETGSWSLTRLREGKRLKLEVN